MTDPIWLDAAHTCLRLTREDGSVLILEAWSDPDLFERASTGAFGAITAFDLTDHIDPLTADDIKAEAHLRIVAIIPEWKQRNLLAQAAVLAEKGRDNWTAQDLADWTAGAAIWAQVTALRTASDRIEALDPIPQDYDDDRHWGVESANA